MSLTRTRALIDVDNPGLIWLVSFTHGANEFFSIIIPPLIPFLVPDLGIGYAEASLLVSVFFATYSVVQLPVGKLVGVVSERLLLAGGMAGLATGIGLVGIASTFPLMLLGMVVAGVGGSTYHPTGMAVISDVESETTHGRCMGIHGAMGTFGSMLAPLLMGAVAVRAGWQAALLTGTSLGLAFALVLYLAYPVVSPEARETRSLAALLEDSTGGGVGELGRRLLWYLSSPVVVGLSALFVLIGAEVRAVQTWTPAFATAVADSGASFGNTMLALTMVSAGVTSAVAGYGVDRIDRRLFAGGCFALTGVVVVALATLSLGRALLTVGFVLLGVVMYAIYPAANAIAAGATADMESGSLFAVTQTAAALGGAAGPLVLGTVADLTSITIGFLATAGIALAGVVVVMFGGAFAVHPQAS